MPSFVRDFAQWVCVTLHFGAFYVFTLLMGIGGHSLQARIMLWRISLKSLAVEMMRALYPKMQSSRGKGMIKSKSFYRQVTLCYSSDKLKPSITYVIHLELILSDMSAFVGFCPFLVLVLFFCFRFARFVLPVPQQLVGTQLKLIVFQLLGYGLSEE